MADKIQNISFTCHFCNKYNILYTLSLIAGIKLMGTMKTLTEIRNILDAHREDLQQQYHVRIVGMFGSYVRGEQKKRSDLDLIAEFDQPISLLGLVGVEIYLSKILKTKVDLIPKEDLRPELKDSILKEALYL